MLQQYREIVHPASLARIGVRYINRIEIEDESVPSARYFKYYPAIPDAIGQNPARLILRSEIPFEKNNGRLVLTLATAPNNCNIFILDLDFMSMSAKKLSFETAEQWVEEAHNKIEIAFESSISDDLRALFEEA